MIDIEREEQRLKEYQNQRTQIEESLARLEGLIEKSEAKRQADTKSERDYDRILDNLWEAHKQAKADLVDNTRLLDRVSKRIERAREELRGQISVSYEEEITAPPDTSGSPPTRNIDSQSKGDAKLKAAQLLASTAIANLNRVPLEQLALAEEYINERHAEGALTPYDAQIAARLEVSAQSDRHREPQETQRRDQKSLRDAVNMVANEAFAEMTLEQIEMVANCHALLTRKTTPNADDMRILNLISAPLQKLARVLTNLQSKMRK